MKRLNARIESENKDLPPHRQQEPVPHYSPHDCRHTAASRLAQSGVPLYDIQALLGHSSYQTTQRYAHLVPGAHTAVESAWSRILRTWRARVVRRPTCMRGELGMGIFDVYPMTRHVECVALLVRS
ncbi:tyrosine-type recombinase/integrase [Herbidospora cretacea]|uniref:tyrosine-type recombinase/integrase n=1 Tax=Herbidospora cretacea TaxID=28444 RepID=UPI0009DD786D